ncbi:MAG: DUF1833 family protein [Rhodoglobus sp.]|nr:DUF1833 family protein [Rhodoglobus sp.]
MSLDRYIAGAPNNALPLHCVELSHPGWAGAHRRVAQARDFVLTLEATAPLDAGAAVTFQGWDEAGNWESPFAKLDDGGVVTRSLRISDVDRTLLAQVDAVRDSEDPILCVIRFYTSDALTVPKIVNRFEMYDWTYGGGELGGSVRTLDLSNMRWPRDRHTDANTPGYRGRW